MKTSTQKVHFERGEGMNLQRQLETLLEYEIETNVNYKDIARHVMHLVDADRENIDTDKDFVPTGEPTFTASEVRERVRQILTGIDEGLNDKSDIAYLKVLIRGAFELHPKPITIFKD